MSVLDNVSWHCGRGGSGSPLTGAASAQERMLAEALLASSAIRERLLRRQTACPMSTAGCRNRAHALATSRGRCCSMSRRRPDARRQVRLSKLIRRIGDRGIAVILVEHDIAMVRTYRITLSCWMQDR